VVILSPVKGFITVAAPNPDVLSESVVSVDPKFIPRKVLSPKSPVNNGRNLSAVFLSDPAFAKSDLT
jgi:hypothetical protein